MYWISIVNQPSINHRSDQIRSDQIIPLKIFPSLSACSLSYLHCTHAMSASCMNDIHTARTYVRQPHGLDRSTSVFHPASSMYARMRKPSQAKHRIYILVRPLLREIRRKTKNLGYPCPALPCLQLFEYLQTPHAFP